jgi:hypothetical protein
MFKNLLIPDFFKLFGSNVEINKYRNLNLNDAFKDLTSLTLIPEDNNYASSKQLDIIIDVDITNMTVQDFVKYIDKKIHKEKINNIYFYKTRYIGEIPKFITIKGN